MTEARTERERRGVVGWLHRRALASLTRPCDGTCGEEGVHDAHLNADWDGTDWIPRSALWRAVRRAIR